MACFDGHILDWLKNKYDEYEIAVKKTLIPAVLSDMLHCIYEALKAMESGKVTIAYMLLRKRIQENLYLFEEMLLKKSDFIKKFGKATREDIDKLLSGKLSDALDDSQKVKKIGNLLTKMRRSEIIANKGSRTAPEWIIAERMQKENR